MKANVSGRQFSIGSLLFVVACAAVYSALYLQQKQIFERPVSLAVLLFSMFMLGTVRSLARISDRATRRTFLLKQTTRNLYRSLVVTVVFWIALAREGATDWLLAWAVIAVLPDLIHWLVQRRIAPGGQRDRVLKILDYFLLFQEEQSDVAR